MELLKCGMYRTISHIVNGIVYERRILSRLLREDNLANGSVKRSGSELKVDDVIILAHHSMLDTMDRPVLYVRKILYVQYCMKL